MSRVRRGGAETRKWSAIGSRENGQEEKGGGVVWFGNNSNIKIFFMPMVMFFEERPPQQGKWEDDWELVV